MADNECCNAEINLLKKQIENSISQVKKLKEDYQHLLIENLQKDVIIRQLKQDIARIRKYHIFENILSKSCLEELRGIGTSIKEDSIFVGVVLKELYGAADSLKQKSLSGRSKNGDKSELTPEKRSTLESIYGERMKYLPVSEAGERKNNLPKLIRNIIDCANRKK